MLAIEFCKIFAGAILQYTMPSTNKGDVKVKYKKILALVTVVALLLSLSTMAYAATGPYYYTVTKTNNYTETEIVSDKDVIHTQGEASVVIYSYRGRVYYFDQSQFVSSHLTGLMQAYRAQGLKESLSVNGVSTADIIPVSIPSGSYAMGLFVRFANGSWNVKIDDTVTYSGVFTSAPIEYWLALVLR